MFPPFMKAKTYSKDLQRGAIANGAVYIVVVLLIVGTASYAFSGGLTPKLMPLEQGTQVIITPPPKQAARQNLQLYSFSGVTVTPTITAPNCSSAVIDSEIIIDASGSMRGTTLQRVQSAAKKYTDVVLANPASRMGVVQFSHTSELLTTLTSNKSAIQSAINRISAGQATCIECGIKTANDDIRPNKRAGIKNLAILLSDGKSNRTVKDGGTIPIGLPPLGGDTREAVDAAKAEALKGYRENGTVFYTIGFGNMGLNETFLRSVAKETGGAYYHAPSEDQLQHTFLSITQQICK